MIVNNEGGAVKFYNEFTCLGSIINFLLDNTVDVESRVPKASKSMGSLRFIWEDHNMMLPIKVKLYDAMLLNLLSCGGENWSGNVAGINKC